MTTTLEPAVLAGVLVDLPPAPRAPVARPRPARGLPSITAASLSALVGGGALLRLWGLGRSRLGYDESFTAMAGRQPLSRMFAFLTAHDSHPPLDYLIHAPFARAAASEFWMRAPSALFSIGALALLAWWLRARPTLAVVATALMAIAPFQLVHGRDARMYAELELLGVAVAVLADRWLRRPRARQSVLLALLVFAGLLTHVSMFLLVAGLLLLPGRRTDQAAWQWRSAIAAGALGWAALWGASFLVQARGGHSAWIPRTSIDGLVTAVGHAITLDGSLVAVAAAATICGGIALVRSDRSVGRVWVCLFAVPVAIGALAGLVAPVVLDRTFTLMAWAPIVAVAALTDALLRRHRIVGAVAAIAMLGAVAGSVPGVIFSHTGPDSPLRLVARHARPGDVIAMRPASKAPELAWTFGARAPFGSSRPVRVTRAPKVTALALGRAHLTGRVWLIDWHRKPVPSTLGDRTCHASWSWGHTRIACIRPPAGALTGRLSGRTRG